jgi:hypothetical protein
MTEKGPMGPCNGSSFASISVVASLLHLIDSTACLRNGILSSSNGLALKIAVLILGLR